MTILQVASGSAGMSRQNPLLRILGVGFGIAVGLGLAKWGGRLAEAQFFKVNASDPAMLAAAVATVLIASILAAYLPARRATRINPTDVLRAE